MKAEFEKAKLIARVAIPAHVYVSIEVRADEPESEVLARAAKIVEDAEAVAEYLELSEGFEDDAEPVVYPVRDERGNISALGASIEDLSGFTREAP